MSEIVRDSNGNEWRDGAQTLRGGLPEDDPGLAALRTIGARQPRRRRGKNSATLQRIAERLKET